MFQPRGNFNREGSLNRGTVSGVWTGANFLLHGACSELSYQPVEY